MKNVAIYLRGPINDELTQYNKGTLIRIARENHWISTIYEEDDKGRSTWPKKAELLSLLRKHTYDGLLIFSLINWSRNSTGLILEFDEFIGAGIFIYSIVDRLQLIPNSDDPMTMTLLAFARFERSLINRKRKIAIELSKYKGKKLGRPCGSKDKVKRKTEGYLKREALKRNLKALHASNIHFRP